MPVKEPAEMPEVEAAAGEFRNRIVGLEYHDAADLVVNPKNWRTHPEGQRSALLAALHTIGVADAMLAYRPEPDGPLVLIDGHLRRDLLNSQVPVLVLDLTEDEADLLLASHDVLTTMAGRDEEMLAALLDDIETEIPRDLLVAIDPDLEGYGSDALDELAEEGSSEDAKYPILPMYDEGYDSLIVFATSETDFNWISEELKLPTVRDRNRIGMSHVLTVEQFRKLWDAKKSK